MPDRYTLAETEKAMSTHVSDLTTQLSRRGSSFESLPSGERRSAPPDQLGAARARAQLDRLCGAVGGMDLGRARDAPRR